ncbi:hypothetical protein JW756_03250 [Candidatus Woesearchaeota archaeon]|nr:hypothetical protein [Candidatus Woesearchaeota archaeon]
MSDNLEEILGKIHSIDDILPGSLPGYLFPKLIVLNHLIIEPYSDASVGNICYYLHFNNKFRLPKRSDKSINLLSKESIEAAFEPYKEMDEFFLEPGKSVIAQSYEKVGVSEWLLCKLENTSALGRVLINHASHGFIHPGHGINKPFQVMMELTNLGEKPVEILPARQENGVVKGPEAFRLYVEKLPYAAREYQSVSSVNKLKMDSKDGS